MNRRPTVDQHIERRATLVELLEINHVLLTIITPRVKSQPQNTNESANANYFSNGPSPKLYKKIRHLIDE